MTKKDYVAFAEILSKNMDEAKGSFDRTGREEAIKAVAKITQDLATLFKRDNEKFLMGKFLKAAGL